MILLLKQNYWVCVALALSHLAQTPSTKRQPSLHSQEDVCLPGICSDNYTKPPELMAGIFYGASFRDQVTNAFPPVNNQGVALGLILGDLNGVVQPFSSENTYNQILNPPKTLITVEDTNHYSITNQDNLLREPNRPTLDQETAIKTIARRSALFLQAHLQDNKTAFNYIYSTGDAPGPNVSVMSQSNGVWHENSCVDFGNPANYRSDNYSQPLHGSP